MSLLIVYSASEIAAAPQSMLAPAGQRNLGLRALDFSFAVQVDNASALYLVWLQTTKPCGTCAPPGDMSMCVSRRSMHSSPVRSQMYLH